MKLGVPQAFPAATTLNIASKRSKVPFRDQWSLCALLINQNGKDSHSANDEVPKVIASFPRPTQELAYEAMGLNK